jgi:hypothetical protein
MHFVCVCCVTTVHTVCNNRMQQRDVSCYQRAMLTGDHALALGSLLTLVLCMAALLPRCVYKPSLMNCIIITHVLVLRVC